MPEIPSRIVEIAEQLRNNKRPRRRTVRRLLRWFGAKKRGPNVIADIQSALRYVGITTDPDLAHAGLDEPLRFVALPAAEPIAANSGGGDAAGLGTPRDDSVAAAQPEGSINLATPVDEDLHTEDDIEAGTDYADAGKADDRPVSSQPNDWNAAVLRGEFDRGQLNLQPRYQREYVWELRPELPSRLIESLLLEIPIPPLYFGKMPDGRLEVIDGQQRLTTLIKFTNNEFPLRGLQQMHSLNAKYFRDLSKEHQAKISYTPIRSVVIDAGNNTDLRYQIFERLNRGTMALNEQEIRNCVFRGPFNDLLGRLEKDKAWRRVKGGANPEPRFKEREMILRFFAFANRLDYYKGNLKKFLTDYMESTRALEGSQIEEHVAMFRETMQNVYAVFGDRSTRLYLTDPKTNHGWWDSKFSIAVLDIQASALMHQPAAKVQSAAEQIREQFLFLLLTNPDLRESISGHSAGVKSTKLRWTMFRSLIQPLLNNTAVEPRFFDYQFRRRLYDASPVCRIPSCGNEIHSFEDSTVDHIIPYSKGGKTVPENAQLAHRSCNARKNATLGYVS